MSCDVGEVMERLENELCFPSLHLSHNSFSKPSVTLPTSQSILQPFRCFTYVTAHSPILPLLHIRHRSFSNPPFASPTSQALHLRHLASRPWSSFLVEVFSEGFPSTVGQMPGNLKHIRPRLSYGHHISSKQYIIRLWTATVSDHSSST